MDRDFRKALARLPAQEQEARLAQLSHLIARLQAARHPTNDPVLVPFRPGAYRSVASIAGGSLVEYRLPYPMRVVTLWLDPSAPAPSEQTVLLLTVTLRHDHDRMKELIRREARNLDRFGKDRGKT